MMLELRVYGRGSMSKTHEIVADAENLSKMFAEEEAEESDIFLLRRSREKGPC